MSGEVADLKDFFFSSRRRHTRSKRDWSSDVCSSDLQTIEQLARVWGSIRNRDLFDRNPLRMAYRYMRSHNSFFDSRYLRTLAAMNLPATFEQLTLPCAVIATNLTRARKEIFTTGSVPDAVAASSAIPGLFNPYRIGNEEFVDGAVAENVGLAE